MELRQLEYLVAVVEEGSFTRGAARLHLAQPGLSAQIKRLEAELGETLIDRRTMTPTDAGAAVLPHARAALAAVAGVRGAVDDVAGLVRGRVAVGMITACPVELLPGRLADFAQAHPGVEVELVEGDSDALLEGVASGRLDLALVGLAGATTPATGGLPQAGRGAGVPHGLEAQVVAEEPLCAAVPAGHALAQRRSLAPRALADHPLIALPRGTGGRAALEAACRRAGVTPRVVVEASDPRVLAAMAARGLGVAILPDSGWDDLVLVPVNGLRSRLALVWREDPAASPAARELRSPRWLRG